jgi:hypothetical protein
MTSRQAVGEAGKLIRRYLTQLNAALQGVYASRRQEILAEVRGHIGEQRTGLDPDDTASVRTLLDKVGRRKNCARSEPIKNGTCIATSIAELRRS